MPVTVRSSPWMASILSAPVGVPATEKPWTQTWYAPSAGFTSVTASCEEPDVDEATTSLLVNWPSPFASRRTNRSLSSVFRSKLTWSFDAWCSVMLRLTLAVDDTSGSSCFTWTFSVVGWLRPNASAFSPVRSTFAFSVTSKLSVSADVVRATADGATCAAPRVVFTGVYNLSPLKLTWCHTTAPRPSCAGPDTMSREPPVAVLNFQMPAPVFVFGLLPIVSRMYGSPINEPEPLSNWYELADRPNSSV